MTDWRGMDENPRHAGTYRVKVRLAEGGEVWEAFSWRTAGGYWCNCYPVHERLAWAEAGEGPAGWESYLLAQGDPWGDHVYAGGRCYTLRSQGCFITCCAMAQRILGVDPDATPLTVDEAVGPEGYDGCYLKWEAMNERLGLGIRSGTLTEAVDHLRGGGVVFVEVQPTSLMHFVCAVAWGNGDFTVLDPWKAVVGHLCDLYDGAESYRLISTAG